MCASQTTARIKFLSAVGEEDCQKKERRRGQDGQKHPHCAQAQADASKRSENVFPDFHILLILLFSTIVEMTCRIAVTG